MSSYLRTGALGKQTDRERRVISYYVSKLYAVSKSFAKRQLDTAADRALSCLFFFYCSAAHSEKLLYCRG
jgi:hypothetical protein